MIFAVLEDRGVLVGNLACLVVGSPLGLDNGGWWRRCLENTLEGLGCGGHDSESRVVERKVVKETGLTLRDV